MNAPLPILYSFRRCPYAMRARMAVLFAGKKTHLREVLLSNKPAAMLAASPKGTVPVLVLPDGHVIDESLQIMFWALGHDHDARQLALIEENDTDFKYNLDRYKYPNRYENVDPHLHRSQAMSYVNKLASILNTDNFLSGTKYGLADLASFAFVRQFAAVDQNWFQQNAPSSVIKWLGFWLNSKEFVHVMKKQKPWQEVDDPLVFPFENTVFEIAGFENAVLNSQ